MQRVSGEAPSLINRDAFPRSNKFRLPLGMTVYYTKLTNVYTCLDCVTICSSESLIFSDRAGDLRSELNFRSPLMYA